MLLIVPVLSTRIARRVELVHQEYFHKFACPRAAGAGSTADGKDGISAPKASPVMYDDRSDACSKRPRSSDPKTCRAFCATIHAWLMSARSKRPCRRPTYQIIRLAQNP